MLSALQPIEKWIVLVLFSTLMILAHYALLKLSQLAHAARVSAETENKSKWQVMMLRATEALSQSAADAVTNVENTMRPLIKGSSPDGTLAPDQAQILFNKAKELAWTQAKTCFGAALAAVGENVNGPAPVALDSLIEAAVQQLASSSRAKGNVAPSVAPAAAPAPLAPPNPTPVLQVVPDAKPAPEAPKTAGFVKMRTMMALAFASVLVACAFLHAAGNNVTACEESDPTIMARLLDALISLGEQQWVVAVQDLVPNADTAKCDMAAIISAAEQPDGGFSYTLSDGGVVTANVQHATSAVMLGETNQQRAVRRAKTYLSLTQ